MLLRGKKMRQVSLKKVLLVIQKTLDSMDERLIGHGEEVAYIMYKLLKASNNYSKDEILKLMKIAMFHDIGAYKVEERNTVLDIDLEDPMDHAVYGSLFIKYFSPLSDLAPVILGHHLYAKDYDNEMKNIIPKEALLLHLADYIAILKMHCETMEKSWMMDMIGEIALPEHKKLFDIACDKYNLLDKIKDNSYSEELYKFFDAILLTREEVISYIKMLTYAIDFRSEVTVIHAITVEEISLQIANVLDLDERIANKIRVASMIHDIGKIATPVEILEKPGKLTNEEYEKIKEHSIIGYKILSDVGLDDLRDIATLHHEKLDGTGYPFGLKGDEISREVRVVAIADVISALVYRRSYKSEFSDEDVISILSSMAFDNKIDSEICNLVIDNYDFIMNKVTRNIEKRVNLYNSLMEEHKFLLNYLKKDF